MLRPQESEGDHWLAYYLPKEDDDAEEYKSRRRRTKDGNFEPEDEAKTVNLAFHLGTENGLLTLDPRLPDGIPLDTGLRNYQSRARNWQ